jgi:hypothetical protein
MIFGPETERVGHDLGLRGGESPRGLALGQAAQTRAGVRTANPEPDSRSGKLGVGVASQIGIHVELELEGFLGIPDNGNHRQVEVELM